MAYLRHRSSPSDDSTHTSLRMATMNRSPTLGLYKHCSRFIMFTLVVDDFGIKSHGQSHLDHLLSTLRQIYTMKTGDGYFAMSLDWDYSNRTVSKSMPEQFAKNLQRFDTRPEATLLQSMVLRHTRWPQSTIHRPYLPRKKNNTRNYWRISLLRNTKLKKITELRSLQATATEAVARKVADFLQYAATYPVTKVTYHDMTLHTHSDASYL
jgi:hypothetical protein